MIELKSPAEIEKMRRASRIVAEVLAVLAEQVRPGVTTGELDRIAEEKIRQAGAIPAFKGYRGYQHTLCASINEEVVHGIPGRRELKSGDIIGLDLGAIWEGFYGDSAKTFGVGKISDDIAKLLRVTEESLHKGIAQMSEGARLGDVSWAVQQWCESHGYSVVRDFVGHGIGRALHEEPSVPNYGKAGTGIRLKRGLVLAIEPMVNLGGPEVKVLDDGWTAVTKDGRWSAHFEHTIALTEHGAEVLTVSKF